MHVYKKLKLLLLWIYERTIVVIHKLAISEIVFGLDFAYHAYNLISLKTDKRLQISHAGSHLILEHEISFTTKLLWINRMWTYADFFTDDVWLNFMKYIGTFFFEESKN